MAGRSASAYFAHILCVHGLPACLYWKMWRFAGAESRSSLNDLRWENSDMAFRAAFRLLCAFVWTRFPQDDPSLGARALAGSLSRGAMSHPPAPFFAAHLTLTAQTWVWTAAVGQGPICLRLFKALTIKTALKGQWKLFWRLCQSKRLLITNQDARLRLFELNASKWPIKMPVLRLVLRLSHTSAFLGSSN